MNRLWRLPLVGLVLPLAACQQQQTAPQPPPPKVAVSQPVVREVVEWDEYTGRLEAVESVEVRSRVSGYLQSVHFADGATVRKGALLFVIDPRPYQAEVNRAKAALEQATAQYERTQKDYARAQQLVKSRAISQEGVDTRASDQRQAEEAVRAARATIEAARLKMDTGGEFFQAAIGTIFTTMPPGTSLSPITSADAGRQARRGATGYRPC